MISEGGEERKWVYCAMCSSSKGEDEGGGLSDRGVVAAKIARQPEQRESVNDPLRRIKIVPLRSVTKIARVGMMKIMVALPETDEGDQPAIATAVLLSVGLGPHHMAERIDREGRVQDHEHPEEPAQ